MYNKEFDNIEIPENIDLYIKKGLKKAVNEKKSSSLCKYYGSFIFEF